MTNSVRSPQRRGFSFGSVLLARCPNCGIGRVYDGLLKIRPRCAECNYDFNPEPGFYLGAVAISFILTAVLTVPPLIFLKIMNVDIKVLLIFPFVEYIFVGTFLVFYSRILWLHIEYRMTSRLNKDSDKGPH